MNSSNYLPVRVAFSIILWVLLGGAAEFGDMHLSPELLQQMVKINGYTILFLLPIVSLYPWWKLRNQKLWFCYLMMVFVGIINICIYKVGHYGFATSGIMISVGLYLVGFIRAVDLCTEMD